MKKFTSLIFSLILYISLSAQANGGWGICEFTTVAAMNAYDPSGSNYSCKKVFVQATDEHYQWDGTVWVLETTGGGGSNIYTANGTLGSDRTVTMGAFNLQFDMTSTGDFNILDNGTQAFTVKDDGLVGIGNVTPIAPLHIYEATGTAPSATDGTIVIEHGDSGGQSSIVFKSNVNVGDDFAYISYADDGSGNGFNTENGLLEIGVRDDASTSNRVDDIAIMPSGALGIGTIAPKARLDVDGGSVRFSDYGIGTYDTGNETYIMGVEADGDLVEVDPSTLGSGSSIYSTDGTLAGNRTMTMSGNDLTFDGTGDIILQDDGKIGVGTVSPAEQLDVRGTIIGALPCVAVAMCTEDSDNSDTNVMGLMVASVPSTNKVYVKSIQDKDAATAPGLQQESSWTNGAAGAWNDFGDPSGGAAGYIMDISVSIEFGGDGDEDDFGGVITVRWSDGTIYVLSTDDNTIDDNAIDDLANWGASWSSWNGPGM